jgi:hypothetical protein
MGENSNRFRSTYYTASEGLSERRYEHFCFVNIFLNLRAQKMKRFTYLLNLDLGGRLRWI